MVTNRATHHICFFFEESCQGRGISSKVSYGQAVLKNNAKFAKIVFLGILRNCSVSYFPEHVWATAFMKLQNQDLESKFYVNLYFIKIFGETWG